MVHHTSFVIPSWITGLEYSTPVLVLGGETAEECAQLPLVSSLHRIG